MTGVHVPVLYKEVLFSLGVRRGGVYIDGTVGGGGHAEAILEQAGPRAQLLGIDRDPAALQEAGRRLAAYKEQVVLRHGSFANLAALAEGFIPADGVLLDLGLSSAQLADAGRGFSFAHDGPLDMRFDPMAGGETAADLVNGLSVKELAGLLYRYGEERQARRIAEAIAAARPVSTTVELAGVIEGVVGRRERIHPATRTFQALRIAVNDELKIIETALPQALHVLAPGGRLVVISFHSLEDRIVKRFLQRESRDCLCPSDVPLCTCGHTARLRLLARKPVQPTEEETATNPRARSARMRAAEKIVVVES